MPKPYTAESLKGAERRVRNLEKQIATLRAIAQQYEWDRIALAKLAAEGPAFTNPIDVYNAKQVRNAILERLGMNPDGSFKSRNP